MIRITSDYELNRFCEMQTCDCRCTLCPAFVSLQRYELGFDDGDKDEEEDEEQSY